MVKKECACTVNEFVVKERHARGNFPNQFMRDVHYLLVVYTIQSSLDSGCDRDKFSDTW